MEYTYDKLRGRIIEKYGSQGKFAEKIGLSETSVSKKMNRKSDFDQNDIVKWCEALDIPLIEAGAYFFA